MYEPLVRASLDWLALFQEPIVNVSVIIPVLNEADRIAASVTSAQTAGAFEVIVADGGSQDESIPIARHLGCRIVHSDPGRARQQNAGAQAATGDVLLFLHADNTLSENSIEQVKRSLRDPQRIFGAFRQQIQSNRRIYRWIERGNGWRVRWRGLAYGDQAIFVRVESFSRLGGFADVALMEDVILSRQLRKTVWPVLLEGPVSVDARRWDQHGAVRQTLRNWCLLAGFHLGISPDRLAKYYRRHDRGDRSTADSSVGA